MASATACQCCASWLAIAATRLAASAARMRASAEEDIGSSGSARKCWTTMGQAATTYGTTVQCDAAQAGAARAIAPVQYA